MPATGVYFVSPRSIAAIAAFLTLSGVSKSGSPTDSEMMSRPVAFRSRAFCVTAMVAEGFTRESASEMNAMMRRNPWLWDLVRRTIMARSGGGNPQRYFPETASIHIFYNDRIWRCKIWFRLRDGRISPSRRFSNIEISCLQRPVRAAPYRYCDFQKIDSANFLNYRKNGMDHRSP